MLDQGIELSMAACLWADGPRFIPHVQSLAPPSLQIGHSVLEPHDHQVRGRRRERSKRPAQRARYEGSDQISRTHSQPYRKEVEASPQLDLFRMVSEVPRNAPEGQSTHQREGQD